MQRRMGGVFVRKNGKRQTANSHHTEARIHGGPLRQTSLLTKTTIEL